MKKIISILICLAFAINISACSSDENNVYSDEIPKLNPDNLRIIGTSPAVVDILDKLEIDLVGVPSSEISVIPSRYDDATVIGTAMSPDMEIVKSLDPDWILSPVTLLSDLKPKYEAAEINSAFLDLRSVKGMYTSIGQLGYMFDRQNLAEDLINDFELFYEKYKEKTDGKESPTVLVLMGLPGSYIVATPKSYVGSLVEMAGGINVYSEEDKEFLNVNTEDLSKTNPDIILRTAHALPESVKEMFAEEFETNTIWKHFGAVKNEKVYDLDHSLFGMSAKFNYEEALEELYDIFYGDAVND